MSQPRTLADEAPPLGPVLERGPFIDAALVRSPSLEAARQAWRGALARYPQETTLQDPTLRYSLAPASLVSSDTRFGQVVSLAQRLPWPGKLRLRGAVALAEAGARRADLLTHRRRLALVASVLFDNWYMQARALEINGQHEALLHGFQRSAEALYSVGRAAQQDPLQAEVALAHLAHERVVIETRRGIIAAQINGLLGRGPDAAVPPPPPSLALPVEAFAGSDPLVQRALESRPELLAGRVRVLGAEAATEVEQRAYYPDFTLSAGYNSMWMRPEHQFMAGVSLNIPIQLDGRDAAVDAAEAKARRARAEVRALAEEIGVAVEKARRRLIEAQHVAALYSRRLLPASRDLVVAAEAGFTAGRGSFLALIDAQRGLRTAELAHQQAIASSWSRWAELRWTLGEPVGPMAGGAAK